MADERTLVADIKSYIDELDSGFKAEVEEHPEGSITRVDLIVRYNNQILFNGEFKRPYTIEGKNPRSADLVDDAYLKSSKLSTPSRFFITSNFNETVIWDNKENDRPLMSRDIDEIKLPIQVRSDEDFKKDSIKSSIKETFQLITKRILEFYQGIKQTKYKPLDESFIIGLNSHLNSAVDIAFKYVKEPVNNAADIAAFLRFGLVLSDFLASFMYDLADKPPIVSAAAAASIPKVLFGPPEMPILTKKCDKSWYIGLSARSLKR